MSENKKVVITGATGLIGKTLCNELQRRNYPLVVVTRDITTAQKVLLNVSQFVDWNDTEAIGKAIDGAYGVINLVGAAIIGKRWTEKYKKVLLVSRITTTEAIIVAIKKAEQKPKVLINGSAVGFYGYVPKETGYDETSPSGSDFLAQICVAWEKEASHAIQYGTRVIFVRTGIVLDKHEGALPRMLTPFYYYIGGPIGSGKQWFPWIHVQDEVGIICFALENEKVSGPINSVSPDAVTNREFSSMVGKVLHKPSILPVPTFVLKLMFGEAAVVITAGVKVSSQRIIQLGYKFHYPKLQEALKSILQ